MKNVKPGHTQPIVCLDAGHYGNKYNRSPVVKDYYESIMTWALHNYLAAELESLGILVTKTRTDQAMDLALVSRGKASKGSDLLISVHSNACNSESVDRPVGIYLVDDDCGEIDAQSKEVAKLLANVVRDVMQTKDKAQTYSRLAGGDRDGDGSKNDDYYGVLYGAHQVGTAGVIIEHSFHTNTRAAKWLLDDANLRAMAKAEAKVLAEYFDMDTADNKEDTAAPEEVPAQTTSKAAIKAGDIVTLAADATYYSGKPIPSWAFDAQWIVDGDPVGDRAVINKSTDGKHAINSPVNIKYLTVVGASAAKDSTTSTSPSTTTSGSAVKVDAAKSGPDATKKGTYVVKSADGCLSLRAGAAVSKQLIETMPNGTKVTCYGYHTGDWLYVVNQTTGHKGFCHSGYLTKM